MDNVSIISEKVLYTSPLLLKSLSYSEDEIYEGNSNFLILKQESLRKTREIISKHKK